MNSTEFRLRQKVFIIGRNHVPIYTPCNFCGEIGRIVGLDKSTRLCPVCFGEKNKKDYKLGPWIIIQNGRIAKIVTDQRTNIEGGPIIIHNEYHLYKPISGNPSRAWLEGQIFSNKKSATKECNFRNAQLAQNEHYVPV